MNKKIIVDGLYFFDVEGKRISFTTDNPNFKPKSIQHAMEYLYRKFNIVDFKVEYHVYEAKEEQLHDCDIVIEAEDESQSDEIAHFIAKEIYGLDLKW